MPLGIHQWKKSNSLQLMEEQFLQLRIWAHIHGVALWLFGLPSSTTKSCSQWLPHTAATEPTAPPGVPSPPWAGVGPILTSPALLLPGHTSRLPAVLQPLPSCCLNKMPQPTNLPHFSWIWPLGLEFRVLLRQHHCVCPVSLAKLDVSICLHCCAYCRQRAEEAEYRLRVTRNWHCHRVGNRLHHNELLGNEKLSFANWFP